MKTAAFFFGSGISRQSGAPMVNDLTNSLLTGAWKLHTDSRFYPCTKSDGSTSIGTAKRAQDFIAVVKAHIDPHLLVREGRTANYEDLYAALWQIFQDETFEIVTPMIARSLMILKADTAHLHVGHEDYVDNNTFATLADRAINLIQWVVYHGLARAATPTGMNAISDVADVVERLDIFSLNHDRLIERQFTTAKVVFTDGFTKKRGDLREWDPRWDDASYKVRLFKLHGSTNWYRCDFNKGEYRQFAAFDTSDIDHARDENGALVELVDFVPMFLTGTTVKEQAYGISLVGDLFFKFRDVLSQHRTLVMCGYGWSDKGINARLDQWLRDQPSNRMVILHAGPLDEIRAKRFWKFRWDAAEKTGKVVIISKWLSDVTVADLETVKAFDAV